MIRKKSLWKLGGIALGMVAIGGATGVTTVACTNVPNCLQCANTIANEYATMNGDVEYLKGLPLSPNGGPLNAKAQTMVQTFILGKLRVAYKQGNNHNFNTIMGLIGGFNYLSIDAKTAIYRPDTSGGEITGIKIRVCSTSSQSTITLTNLNSPLELA